MNPEAQAWRYAGEAPKEPFHYTGCGLDDVYLLSGYEVEETPYGETVTIKNLDGLHKVIGLYLVENKKILDGKELRFLRNQMDITQSELARLVGYDTQQVARGEKGENKISGPADRLLRLLYKEQRVGHFNIRGLLEVLDRTDGKMHDRTVFTETPKGWKAAAA
jgi:putative transcriptional regulator